MAHGIVGGIIIESIEMLLILPMSKPFSSALAIVKHLCSNELYKCFRYMHTCT